MTNSGKEFLKWSLTELAAHLKAKALSPVEVTGSLLERIDIEDKKLNSYITVMHDEAMEAAKEAEDEIARGNYRGPLHGVPLSLKDLIFTKGVPTTMGSEFFKDYITDYDATVTRKLKDAGAVIIGKVNLHQFAYGPLGDRSYFGPTRNPHNTAKFPGGSSGGSGAAVAAGLCYGSLGTDTGGSIRIPSSLCGVVGMKPTFGRVSKYGAFPLSWTLDHIGPMTRTIEDNVAMFAVVAGHDPQDYFSANVPVDVNMAYIKAGIRGGKIGIPKAFFFEDISPEVLALVEKAIRDFERMGAEIKEVEIPHIEEISLAHSITLMSEAFTVHEERLRSLPDKFEEEVRNRLLPSIFISASEYLQAQQVRQLGIREFNKALADVDVLLAPGTAIVAQDVDQREVDINGKTEAVRTAVTRIQGPGDITGLPSLTVPCGLSGEGLPVAYQLMGKAFDEATLYRYGYAYEQQSDFNPLKYDINDTN